MKSSQWDIGYEKQLCNLSFTPVSLEQAINNDIMLLWKSDLNLLEFIWCVSDNSIKSTQFLVVKQSLLFFY